MTSESHDPDTEPEIDFVHLNQYVAGDIALTQEIFGLFQHQVEMWGRMLLPEADDESWASVTHSLKGSARAVGAIGLGDLCEQAESLIGAGNRPGLRDMMVQNIEYKISKTIMEIQRWEYRNKINSMRR